MDIVSAWSLKIAEETVPDEADLAPIMAQAFIEGGKTREELFYKAKGGALGAFGAGDVAAVFPWILDGITSAAPFILSMLTTDSIIKALLSTVKDILSIRDSLARKKKSQSLPDNPYGSLRRAVEILSEKLQSVQISQDERDLIVYRVLRAFLEDPHSAAEFVQKVNEVPGE